MSVKVGCGDSTCSFNNPNLAASKYCVYHFDFRADGPCVPPFKRKQTGQGSVTDLASFFLTMLLISLLNFGGTPAQPLFDQFAVQGGHWISGIDFTAILALGYATPGPAVFGTAAFIGYKVAGLPGAALGSIAIFTAPWLLSLIAARFLMKLLQRPQARHILKGIGLAAAGLLAATALGFASQGGIKIEGIIISIATFVAIIRFEANPFVLLLVGGLLGLRM